MRKNILFLFVFLSMLCLKAQVYSFNYQFSLKNFTTGNVVRAIVYAEKGKKEKIYKFSFVDKTNLEDRASSDRILRADSYEYLLYTKDGKDFLIKDYIQGKYYMLVDSIPESKWIMEEEDRQTEGVVLHKATTHFRGREYTAWYQRNETLQVAPWKFTGIPGIVYEIYDDSGNFSWRLENYKKENIEIENPFEDKETFVSYKKYPKLRYGLSEKLEKALSKNPNRTMFEQPRVDLEIAFEWE